MHKAASHSCPPRHIRGISSAGLLCYLPAIVSLIIEGGLKTHGVRAVMQLMCDLVGRIKTQTQHLLSGKSSIASRLQAQSGLWKGKSVQRKKDIACGGKRKEEKAPSWHST